MQDAGTVWWGAVLVEEHPVPRTGLVTTAAIRQKKADGSVCVNATPIHTSALARLAKLLRIREGEGRKVVHFAGLAAMVQAGISIGLSTAYSLFLEYVGADRLPLIYVTMPIVMLVYVPVGAYLQNRFGNERTFAGALLALAVSCAALSGALAWGGRSAEGPVLQYYVSYVFAEMAALVLFTLLWNFIDRYFDILDAKRLYSLFSGGMAAGAIVGGLAVALLVRHLTVPVLYGLWGLIAAATLPVIRALRREWTPAGELDEEADDDSVPLSTWIGTLFDGLRGSRYVVALVSVFASMLVIATVCEYQYMHVFESDRTDAEIAALLGILYAAVNVFSLIANLLIVNRLVVSVGVRNTALIQPIAFCVAFSLLFLAHGFGAAIIAFFVLQGIMPSVDFNNQNFLFQALPSRLKAQLRTVIEGLGEPVATGVAGVALLAAAELLSAEMLALAGLVGAIVCVLLAFWLRHEYARATVANLRDTWLDFGKRGTDAASEKLEPGEIDILSNAARASDSDRAVQAIRILWIEDHTLAVDLLLELLDRISVSDQQCAAPLLSVMLREDDGDVLRRILAWLRLRRTPIAAELASELCRHNLLSAQEVEGMLQSADPDSRAAASVALWRSWQLEANYRGIRITRELLNGTAEERLAAIRAMGKLDQPRYARFLRQFLRDPSPGIRKQALATMYDLVREDTDSVLRDLMAVVRSGDRAERLMGLEALGKIGSTECIAPLARAADRFVPFERRQAEAVIERIGLRSVPNLLSLLRSHDCPYSGKSMAARVLGRISFAQLGALAEELIADEIRNAYAYLGAHQALNARGGGDKALSVLRRFCRDVQAEIVELVLELLTISGRLPDFELMTASLRSGDSRDRANAIEAIEQACPRRVYRRLLPLLDAASPADALDTFTKLYHTPPPTFDDALEWVIRCPYPFGGAAAAQVALTRQNVSTTAPQTHRNRFSDLIRNRIIDAEDTDQVAEVVFSILMRREYPDDPRSAELNLVERVEHIASTRFFESFSITGLVHLGRRARQRYVPEGRALFASNDPAREIGIVTEGSMETTAGLMGVLGEETLLGKSTYENTVVSAGAQVLVVPHSALTDTVERHPAFGLRLLEHRAAAETGA